MSTENSLQTNNTPALNPEFMALPEDNSSRAENSQSVQKKQTVFQRFSKVPKKSLVGALALLLLLVGGVSAYVLSTSSLDIRQQASGYAACAGGVPHGAKSCGTLRQVVSCNNGAFVNSQSCSNSERCDNGRCVAAESSGTPNSSNRPSSSGNPSSTGNPSSSGNPNSTGAPSSTGNPTANNGNQKYTIYQEGDSYSCQVCPFQQQCAYTLAECKTIIEATVDTKLNNAPSCGTSDGLFSSQVSNSSLCKLNGAAYYKCNSGYKNSNGRCAVEGPAETAVTDLSSCGTGVGLFQNMVTNSSPCNYNGVRYYKCNTGYFNSNNACAVVKNQEPIVSCGTGNGLFAGQVANSSPCTWQGQNYFRCNSGYENSNNSCRPSDQVQRELIAQLPSCGTDYGLFTAQVGNSSACNLNGSKFFKCNSGFQNSNNQCRSDADVQAYANSPAGNTCGTADNLFASRIANSSECTLGGAIYYRCNDSYTLSAGECTKTVAPVAQAVPNCGDGFGFLSSPTVNANACMQNGRLYYKCQDGFVNYNNSCVRSDSIPTTPNATVTCYAIEDCNRPITGQAQCAYGSYANQEDCRTNIAYAIASNAVQTYRLVGSGLNMSCALCEDATQCGYTKSACEFRAELLNGQKMCWAKNSCDAANYKGACEANEYESQSACLTASQTAPSQAQGSGALDGATLSGE